MDLLGVFVGVETPRNMGGTPSRIAGITSHSSESGGGRSSATLLLPGGGLGVDVGVELAMETAGRVLCSTCREVGREDASASSKRTLSIDSESALRLLHLALDEL